MKNSIFTYLFAALCSVFVLSCSFDRKTETTSESTDEPRSADLQIREGGVDADAEVLARYLTTSLIADEVEYLSEQQRTFRYAQADLNEDGEPEYLIELRNSFFCGTGGCTYLLISQRGELLTMFTVSESPFYVLTTKTSGWHDLVIPRDGVYNIIRHNGKAYPSNPSVEPEVTLDDVDIAGTMITQAISYSF